MKDIIISKKRQKTELIIFFICFLVAEFLNLISIIVYDTRWVELVSHIGYVIVISISFYLFLLFIRLIVGGVLYLIKKAKKQN